ncbi:hypothetical protein B0H19DRAFT_1070560 [Mycena capillaripes]|nr:hypothetical protein B0H19DRAFT_1070560 [Mycena capillaripes]
MPHAPRIPEPPNYLIYGWLLTPELFGPGPHTIAYEDGSIETLKHPTTITQALNAFEIAVFGLRLMDSIEVDNPHPLRPRYARLAEASKDNGVRSRLDDGQWIPPAAKLKQLAETLNLLRGPEWIVARSWLAEDRAAFERKLDECIKPINLKVFFQPSSDPPVCEHVP